MVVSFYRTVFGAGLPQKIRCPQESAREGAAWFRLFQWWSRAAALCHRKDTDGGGGCQVDFANLFSLCSFVRVSTKSDISRRQSCSKTVLPLGKKQYFRQGPYHLMTPRQPDDDKLSSGCTPHSCVLPDADMPTSMNVIQLMSVSLRGDLWILIFQVGAIRVNKTLTVDYQAVKFSRTRGSAALTWKRMALP